MPSPEPIIRAAGLARNFKKVKAVDGLDLDIHPGELFGLVGPDGAGKTTTLRLLAGLLSITAGSATVLGFDLGTQAESIKPYVGYMAQQFSLYAELSVVENLAFFAELFDVPRRLAQSRTEKLLDFAGLSEFKQRRAMHLSGGMQKKLALACTLIHEPQILLLDEPTTGVDPISRREFWNILGDLHLNGTTILVSTPYMDEADRCSRVGLMYAGKLVECDSPAAIRAHLSGGLVEVQTPDWQKVIDLKISLPGIKEIQTYGESIHFLVDSPGRRTPEIEKFLRAQNVRYTHIRTAPVRMEEAFISLIRNLEG
jgi:ABC-2 type transport system ATP-binding protein